MNTPNKSEKEIIEEVKEKFRIPIMDQLFVGVNFWLLWLSLTYFFNKQTLINDPTPALIVIAGIIHCSIRKSFLFYWKYYIAYEILRMILTYHHAYL